MLYLRTFGGCHIERDGTRLDDLSAQRRALAFMARLACVGSRGVTRDVACAMFWPESSEDRARASLKQLVHSLRTRLGTSDVVHTSGDLRLNPDLVATDVGAFKDALRQGDHETAVRLHAGPFLEGFYLRGAGSFEEWTSGQRAALTHDLIGALQHLADRADREGDPAAAVRWWRRLADADPLSTRATLGFMRALEASGDRGAALRHADAFQRLVRKELEVAPDPAVAELAERFRATPSARATPPAGAAPGQKRARRRRCRDGWPA